MRSAFLGSILVILVILAFAFPAALLAQTAKQPGTAKSIPDLSGIWNRSAGHTAEGIFDDDASGVPFLGFTKQEPSLQPAAMEIYKANRKDVADRRLKGRDDSDPVIVVFRPVRHASLRSRALSRSV